MRTKVVIVSGYFNPLHSGHINMFREAKKLGDTLYVIVNSDDQVRLKGSVPFMGAYERMKIVGSIRDVDTAIIAFDEDKTVCQTLQLLHANMGNDCDLIFANGGDRKNIKDIPEAKVCKKLGIKMVFNVGGNKSQSSSSLIANASKKYARRSKHKSKRT